MIGSPAVRDSTDWTEGSLRALAAIAPFPAEINRTKPAMATRAGRNEVCLCPGLVKQDVICVRGLRSGLRSGAIELATRRHITPFGRTCQLGAPACLWIACAFHFHHQSEVAV